MKPSVEVQLQREPYRFDFFEAIRILQLLHPQARPVGEDAPPSRELVRFRSRVSLDFPPCEVYDFDAEAQGGRPPLMEVAFMGLAGANGPLPRWYSEMLLERLAKKDRTLRDFLDLFNHRLVSLFYRAGEKYRFWTSYERACHRERLLEQEGKEQRRAFVFSGRQYVDPIFQHLLDLGGFGTPELRYSSRERNDLQGRTSIIDETLCFYTGLFAQSHRCGAGLEALLGDFFDVGIEIVPFQGEWLPLDPEDKLGLGPLGEEKQLGVNAVLGDRVWDPQGRFRIRVGPLTYARYVEFLPEGKASTILVDLARLYVGRELDFDIELVLAPGEVPPAQLSSKDDSARRLGWETWSLSEGLDTFTASVVLQLDERGTLHFE